MEITIDTRRDSKDDIRKAVEFLKGFLESDSSSVPSGSSGQSDAPAPQAGLFGMFGNDDQSSSEASSQRSGSEQSGGVSSSSTGRRQDGPSDEDPERIEIVPY